MAILPKSAKKLHYNLLLTQQDYIYTLGGLGSTDSLKSAYILNAQGITMNPNAPLLASKLNNIFSFNLRYILNNDAIFINNALPTTARYFPVLGLVKSFTLKIADFVSETLTYYHGNAPDRIFELYDQTIFENFNKLGSPFLSFSPVLKKTKINSPQYLYYLNNLLESPAGIKLKVKITLKNGNQSTIKAYEIQAIAVNDVLGFSVSIADLLQETNLVIEEVSRYQVFVTDNTDKIISEYRTYIIDNSFLEENNIILYRNQLGVFETLDFDGLSSFTNDYTISSFEAEKKMIDYDTTVIQKITFRTTNLEQNWLRHIAEDLLLSNEIYWLHPDGRKIRLTKLSKSIKIRDEKEINERAEIEFRIAKI